ncbi:phage portal protein [Candidatus Pacearchaeota archaeon]|nr:phage portal protein [Candidatus Pacearchaeota archaeon]
MSAFQVKDKTSGSAGRIIKSTGSIRISHKTALLLNGNPFALNLTDYVALEREFRRNPVLSSVINLKADYASNAVISVRNVKNGEIFTDKDFKENKNLDPVVRNMFRLKNNPNPLQSSKEFLTLTSIFKDVFGNSFVYGNVPMGDFNITNIKTMVPIWPQYMTPLLTGKYFDAISVDGIIKRWDWVNGSNKRPFETEEILHRKDPRINFNTDTDLVMGESRQVSLEKPLSNIIIAYDSRNVIARERGMRAIISSSDSDGNMGSIPMGDPEKQEVQADLKTNYGLMEGQDQFMVTRHNIKVHHVDQDVRKLGLLSEIASDGMVVAERYGVPEILVKLYMKGATFENQESSERRMYQNTTIPDANDRIEDQNIWLKCRDFDHEYIVTFDHIPVLQENLKDRSEINLNDNKVLERLFFSGAITYNQWLQKLGFPASTESWAKLRITEMSDDEIFKIKGNYTLNSNTDEDGD